MSLVDKIKWPNMANNLKKIDQAIKLWMDYNAPCCTKIN